MKVMKLKKMVKLDLNDGKGCCRAQVSNFTQECVEGMLLDGKKRFVSKSEKKSLKIFSKVHKTKGRTLFVVYV
jgi:hypothetical protein